MATRTTYTPGTFSWTDLTTPDQERAKRFYGELFGWTFEPLDESPIPYWVIKGSDGHTNGGMTSLASPDTPPHWLVYFGAEDADIALAQVGELGGSTLVEPIDIGGTGRIAVARDPQGAVFALYAGTLDD